VLSVLTVSYTHPNFACGSGGCGCGCSHIASDRPWVHHLPHLPTLRMATFRAPLGRCAHVVSTNWTSAWDSTSPATP
jgi:hypothetical protein